MKYICALLIVKDISMSREFYEILLGQKVLYDHGENIEFIGGFAIHLEEHYQRLLGESGGHPVFYKSHSSELYFESSDIMEDYRKIKSRGIEFLHDIVEQPWGQRVMRVYDPDGHIIEIGEPIEAVLLRFHRAGLSIEEVAARCSMPIGYVRSVLAGSTGVKSN